MSCGFPLSFARQWGGGGAYRGDDEMVLVGILLIWDDIRYDMDFAGSFWAANAFVRDVVRAEVEK